MSGARDEAATRSLAPEMAPGMTPETRDVQAIIPGGHAALAHARFLLLAFTDAPGGRRWTERVRAQVRMADAGPPAGGTAVQLAFSWPGLEALELPWQALKGFSRAFREGMAGNERRSRILGDIGDQDPSRWRWGGPRTPTVHALLMLYADTEQALAALERDQRAGLEPDGVRCLHVLDSAPLPGSREHFGFRDGISQPRPEGFGRPAHPLHRLPLGEVLLGYPNGRGELTATPAVDPIEDPDGLLAATTPERHDLGRNGSYLVFRQLSQDVHGFWSWAARAAGGTQAAVDLAAKMVGRWPGGAPLVRSPDADDPALADANDFSYHHEDRDGLRCPPGAHVSAPAGGASVSRAVGPGCAPRIPRRPPCPPRCAPQGDRRSRGSSCPERRGESRA